MNKYKKLAANTLLFSIGSFSSKILSLFLLKLYTKYIPEADFSVTSEIQYIINLLGPIVTLSISEGILKYGIEKKYKKEQVYTTGLMTCISGLAAGMVILWIISPFLGYQEYLPYMMMFLLGCFLGNGPGFWTNTHLRSCSKVQVQFVHQLSCFKASLFVSGHL